MRADKQQAYKFHVDARDEFFSQEGDIIYRNSKVYRRKIDKVTGNCIKEEVLRVNHAKVLYDIEEPNKIIKM